MFAHPSSRLSSLADPRLDDYIIPSSATATTVGLQLDPLYIPQLNLSFGVTAEVKGRRTSSTGFTTGGSLFRTTSSDFMGGISTGASHDMDHYHASGDLLSNIFTTSSTSASHYSTSAAEAPGASATFDDSTGFKYIHQQKQQQQQQQQQRNIQNHQSSSSWSSETGSGAFDLPAHTSPHCAPQEYFLQQQQQQQQQHYIDLSATSAAVFQQHQQQYGEQNPHEPHQQQLTSDAFDDDSLSSCSQCGNGDHYHYADEDPASSQAAAAAAAQAAQWSYALNNRFSDSSLYDQQQQHSYQHQLRRNTIPGSSVSTLPGDYFSPQHAVRGHLNEDDNVLIGLTGLALPTTIQPSLISPTATTMDGSTSNKATRGRNNSAPAIQPIITDTYQSLHCDSSTPTLKKEKSYTLEVTTKSSHPPHHQLNHMSPVSSPPNGSASASASPFMAAVQSPAGKTTKRTGSAPSSSASSGRRTKITPRMRKAECSHCGVRSTPAWRRDRDNNLVCNACGIYQRQRGHPRPINLLAQPASS